MIRFVSRTDTHLSDHTPTSRTDDWTGTVFGKIRQIGRIAQKVDADAVLDNGDFFDVKAPIRNSHALVRQCADIHEEYPCPVYGNVGNHDCTRQDIRNLPKQPLGVLFATGVFQRCYDEHEHVFDDNQGLSVRVKGIPFHGNKYDLDRFRACKKHGEDYLLVMAHVLASEKGGTMFDNEDVIKYADLLDLAPDVDVWLFGHWHKDQGIKEIAPGKWVINLGSLTRGALAWDDVTRQPAVSVITFTPEGIDIERHDIEIQPHEDVFDVDGRVREESRAATMDFFVDSIRKTLTETEDSASLSEKVEAMEGLPEKVRNRAIEFIETAEGAVVVR
jgi:DNA repair exonuclease SbcCD nuclease subunit